MRTRANDVFRMVNLRGAAEDVTWDPNDDGVRSTILKGLGGGPVELSNPPPALRASVAALVLDTKAVAELRVLFRIFSGSHAVTVGDVASVPVTAFGYTGPVSQLAGLPEFRDAYASTYDNWLGRTVVDDPRRPPAQLEDALRAAHIAVLSADVGPARAVSVLLSARVVVPPTWSSGHARRETARARRASAAPPATTGLDQEIARLQVEYATVVDRIGAAERALSAAHRLYRDKVGARAASVPAVATITVDTARTALDVIARVAKDGAVKTFTRRSLAPVPLDQQFETELQGRLGPAEQAALQTAFGGRPMGFPLPDFAHLSDRLNDLVAGDSDHANALCARIRRLRRQRRSGLPAARARAAAVPLPAISAVGWGDLIVVRERLLGYEAREISHIENVLAGERKQRDHTVTHTATDLLETETAEVRESESELQTTDRNELQTESSRTIAEDFSVEAGVNTSGRYGLTSVDTSLDLGLRRSVQESQRTTTSVAKDIVAKTVERTVHSNRTLRRRITTDEIKEFNAHLVENTASGNGNVPTSRSGVYLWVQKIHELQLRHYGTRLMIEFHVAEPAVGILGYDEHELADTDPPRFDVTADAVTPGNYLCLAQEYAATGVEPPPARFVEVGYPWASQPTESSDDDEAEDVVAATIPLPDGYRPVSAHGIVTALPYGLADFNFYAALGGKKLCESTGDEALVEDDIVWGSDGAGCPWPGGCRSPSRRTGTLTRRSPRT